MRILFSTLPGTLTSTIPPDMRTGYDVADLYSSTNVTRDPLPDPDERPPDVKEKWPFGTETPEKWRHVATVADAADASVMADVELYPAHLAEYLFDRPTFSRNLAKRAEMVGWLRGSGVRFGVYKANIRGTERDTHSMQDYWQYRDAERRALRPDFEIIEGSAQEPYHGGGERGAMLAWQHGLDIALSGVAGFPAVVLLYDGWVNHNATRWAPWTAEAVEEQMRRVNREGATPALWNPNRTMIDVARELSAKN